MAVRLNNNEELFRKLKHGDPMLGTLDILGKLIRSGDDEVHMKLIDEYRDKLDMGLEPGKGAFAGFRMLAHHGSERVQMRLIDEFQDRLDEKGPYVNGGWLLLNVYGTDAVKARIRSDHPEKLVSVEDE